MTTTRAKPIRRAPALAPVQVDTRAAEGRRELRHDPAYVAATLRDLAARAHRAVRALDPSSPRGDSAAAAAEILRELAALHPRIVELQRSIDGETQPGLAAYLSALRREVESRLG